MEGSDFESSIDFSCYIKGFLWIQEYVTAFSTFEQEFSVYDVAKKKIRHQISGECIYSSFHAEDEVLYCGGMLSNNIDEFDFQKGSFKTLYKNEEGEAKPTSYIKIYRNQDKTFVVLAKQSKTHFLNLFDFRKPKPLITAKEFPFAVSFCDNSENFFGLAWESANKFSHSVVDVSKVWPNENSFEKSLQKDREEKLMREDFDLDKKITAIRVSPSKGLLSLGRKNGSVYLYEIAEKSANISQATQLTFAVALHEQEKVIMSKEAGKLPQRKKARVMNLDFFPKKNGKEKEEVLASSGDEGALKFINFRKRKFLKARNIEKSEKFENGFFENVRWNPTGEVLMVLKSPDVSKSEHSDCQMKFTQSPIKQHQEKND